MGGRRLFGLAITGLVLALLALPAHADDWEYCTKSGLHGVGNDVIIRSCSAIIDAGTELAENIAIAHYNRGWAYSKKDDYDRAIEDYDRAIALNPKDASAYYYRGYTYRSKGDYDRSIDDYDRAIALYPEPAYAPRGSAYGGRGLAHEKRGNTEKAIADYRKALELRPGEPFATQGLARLAQ